MIFGVSDRAEKRVAAMQAQIADVAQKVRDEPAVKVIVYGGGQGPLQMEGGRTSITTQIIEAAGGENVFTDQSRFFQAALEAVAAKQADEASSSGSWDRTAAASRHSMHSQAGSCDTWRPA